MQHLYFLIGVAALLVITFVVGLIRQLRARQRHLYRLDAHLFTPEQRAFKAVLEQALGRDYEVFAKIRAADIMEVDRRLERRAREDAEARLDRQLIDYLVCDRASGAILCAVALTPATRLAWRPGTSSLERICALAELPCARILPSERDSVEAVEARVFRAMRVQRRMPRDADEPSLSVVPSAQRERGQVVSMDAGDSPATRISQRARVDRSAPTQAAPARPSTRAATGARVRAEPSLRLDADLELDAETRMAEVRIMDVEIEDERPRRMRG